jgi:hypothetical protein
MGKQADVGGAPAGFAQVTMEVGSDG